MTAGIYLRFSQDRTGEELGIERHRPDCQSLATQRGWESVEYVDNDMSASKGKRRPGYEALMAAADAGKINRIIVWHTSRLWRTRKERADGIERLRKAKVSVVPFKGPELDMGTAYGRGMAGLVGEFDTMEVEVKSERQVREAQQRAEPNGGRRAFGYSRDGRTKVDDEADAVQRAFEALLAGRTLSGIAADLNAAGFTTTMGGPWKHNSTRLMLTNPRYAALRAYNGKVVGAANWPSIVTEDVWRAACSTLTDPERRTNHAGAARRWLGTNLYRCGRDGCDSPLICTYREKYADGRKRRVYRCPACKLSRLADPVDELVCDVVEERLSRDDVADLLADEVGAADTEQLRAEAVSLRARRRSLAALVADEVLTEVEVRADAARLAARIGAVEELLSNAGRGSVLAPIVLAPNPVEAWRATSAQPDRRQAIVGALMVVRLLPPPVGRKTFDRNTVSISRRQKDQP